MLSNLDVGQGMKVMAGAPTLADCEAGCSASTGRWGNVGRSCDLGSGSRRIRISTHGAVHFRLRNCVQGRRRDASICEDYSSQNPLNLPRICNFCGHGEQFGTGTRRVRAQHLGFERWAGAVGSKIGGASVKNPLRFATREELVELIVRRQGAAGRKRKGHRSFTLHASLDPYEVLGVSTSATEKEIKQAYRKLALKLHPDVNKQPDAQQQFLRVKNAYQTLSDEKSRTNYDASKRGSPSWDPFGWDSGRKSAQKSQDAEEFYGFGEFFKDLSVSIDDFFRDLRADNRRQASKPKSLWEELADIGEEFVEFLEKELNINDTAAKEEKSSGYESRSDKKKSDARDPKTKAEGPAQNAPRDQEADKAQVETEIAEIEDMLAQLKKELGI